MSAYLAIAYPDRVELLTDGAVTFNDGTVSDILTKVWTAPTVPLAITGAGEISQVENIARYILGWAALTGVAGALDALSTMPHPAGDLCIVLAGISEDHGPGVWSYSTRSEDNHPAFAVARRVGLYAMGSGLDVSDISATGLTRADFADGIARGGIKLMDAWRRKACVSPARPELGPGYYIGGKVDHTVVTSAGVVTREVHRWPDKIGSVIDPSFTAEQAA